MFQKSCMAKITCGGMNGLEPKGKQHLWWRDAIVDSVFLSSSLVGFVAQQTGGQPGRRQPAPHAPRHAAHPPRHAQLDRDARAHVPLPQRAHLHDGRHVRHLLPLHPRRPLPRRPRPAPLLPPVHAPPRQRRHRRHLALLRRPLRPRHVRRARGVGLERLRRHVPGRGDAPPARVVDDPGRVRRLRPRRTVRGAVLRPDVDLLEDLRRGAEQLEADVAQLCHAVQVLVDSVHPAVRIRGITRWAKRYE